MKKAHLLKLIISFVLFTTFNFAQQKAVETNAQKLAELSKAKNLEEFAKLTATEEGEGVAKKISPALLDNADTKKKVQKLMRKIGYFVEIADSFTLENYQLKTESKAKRYSIDATFINGSQKLKLVLIFVEVNSKFLLVDVEG